VTAAPMRLALTTILALVALVPLAVPPDASAGGTGSWVVNVSSDSSRSNGEPWVAVDPGDTNRIVLTYTGWGFLPGLGNTSDPTSAYPSPMLSSVAVSSDGGATWSREALVPPGTAPTPGRQASNPTVVVGADGTFYQQGYNCAPVVDCRMSVRSLPRGATKWSDWYIVNGAAPTVEAYADGHRYGTPVAATVADVDRPWMAIDQSANVLYLSVAGNQGAVDPANPLIQLLYASHDGGRTWSRAFPMDHPGRQGGILGNGVIAAARGRVAATYTGSIPGESDEGCPCVIFETSSDHGRNWDRHRVPTSVADDTSVSYVAADPSRPGRFAVVVRRADSSGLHIYSTSDAGESWSGPSRLDNPSGHVIEPSVPWVGYSPRGVLGVVWLPSDPSDKSFVVYAAISRSGDAEGSSFSPALLVSPDPRSAGPSYSAGNDEPFVFLDAHHLYATWGGRHDGDLEAWLAKVPLSSFPTHARGQGAR
jgi:photosystem II stability/assembly factor-like uncharacterized protein